MEKTDIDIDAELAKCVAALCVRNSYLEQLHSGVMPHSQTGDYSDVKVVTPSGEIPWNKLSRINDEEMKTFMKQVVNKLYSFMLHRDDPTFLKNFANWAEHFTREWDMPEADQNITKLKHKKAMAD